MFRAPVVPRRPAAGAELGGDEHPRGRGEDEVHSPQEEAGDHRPRLPAGPPPADRKYFNPAQKYLQQLDQLGGQLRTVQESVARVAAAAESAGVMDIERRLQVETAVTVTSVSVSM